MNIRLFSFAPVAVLRDFLLVGLLLFVSGCEELQEALLDCLDDDGPQFDQHAVPTAVLNEMYYAKIRASINNDPRDTLFDYWIEWEGDLPAGLTLTIPDNDRVAIIEGTPTEYGDFYFKLKVRVKLKDSAWSSINEEDYDDGLCYHRDSEGYTLSVVIMASE